MKFKVGDRVKLNDRGLRQIGGIKSIEALKDCQDMTIISMDMTIISMDCTYVDDQDDFYMISVDKESINRFLISTDDIDLLG